jgi:hypothetical protein
MIDDTIEDWKHKKLSHIGYWSKIIDGVPVTIYENPSKNSYAFTFRMNSTISIKSKFDSWGECLKSLEYIKKDMVWRRAK